MNNWYQQFRGHGPSASTVLPIAFGTAVLGNVSRVIAEPAKWAWCGELFHHARLPVWIETSPSYGDGMALDVLGRVLRGLEVKSDEVVVQLTIEGCHASSVAATWERSCRLLGAPFRPKLVAMEKADDAGWKFLGNLKARGDVWGLGLKTTDWRSAKKWLAEFDADWLTMSGCTVMRHPFEILQFMSELSETPTPIVLSGVFEGGFLVGRNQLDGRSLQADHPSDRSRLAWRKAFLALCDGHGIAPSHACIRFALAAPGVQAVRLDTSYADRVAQNIKSACQPLPESFWQSLKEEGLLADSNVLARCLQSN